MIDLVFAACLVMLVVFAVVVSVHDAPNAVALPARVRAVTPRIGVMLSAFFNLLGLGIAMFAMTTAGGSWVALPQGAVGLGILLCTLITGCCWELFTWWRGMPSSSTHAVIGGFFGGLWAAQSVGFGQFRSWALEMAGQVWVVLLAAPLAAFGLAWLLVPLLVRLFRHASPGQVDRNSRHLLTLGLSTISLGHGTFFGHRLMVLALLAFLGTGREFEGASAWMVFLALAGAMVLGTLGGGWRIAHTIGHRLVRMDPFRAALAQLVSAGLNVLTGAVSHSPYSSSHLTAAATLGAGANQRFTSVRVRTVTYMLVVWALTVPVCAVISGILFLALSPVLELL